MNGRQRTGKIEEMSKYFSGFRNSVSAALFAVALQMAPAQAKPAQKPAAPKPAVQPRTDTLVVLGSATPVPLAESPRPVTVLPVKPLRLVEQTPLDILRQDSGVFLEQRGAGGAQSDIVLQGGSFEQTLVLLDGFRINDAQTAHHNLDLPVPMEAMSSIQVLEGAGSTLHGLDALSGVVDFLTAAPQANSLRVRLGEGSFQGNEESLMAGGMHGKFSGRVTADRNFSTGFMADRDYRNQDASAEGWAASSLGLTDVLLAGSDRKFGANQFYGNFPSWEHTKELFGGIRQELGSHTNAAFAFRRHTDEFVLFRNDPAIYENNHIDGSWQALLRNTVTVAKTSVLLMGLEADGDSIRSNNLGIHARNRGAGYIDLDLRPAAHRWNLSAGAREEIFSGGAMAVFSPELAGSLRLNHGIKLRASGGYGFRIPTYTDLYYSDPATVGNPNLLPESAWSGNAGMDWNASRKVMLSVGGFYSQQHDTIDYVRANPTDKWHATNLQGLRFTGPEATLTWLPTSTQSVRVSYTGLQGAQGALHGLQSEYVFNYPVTNIQTEWSALVGRWFTMTNTVQIAQRYQQTPYPVWNAMFGHDRGRLRPYLRLTNLSNTGYQEITGVNMPPREIMGGFAIQLGD
ncbi:MAG: TonB-dependent receptor plug domain-containing protein [Acidobacteriota bacterium]